MFASIGFNQGISAPEIAALDEWGHALMRRAWTYKNKKWPARLYHYTTAEGFKGIIETGVLRGTHVGFTNDFQEYKHAADVALEHAQTLKAQTTSDNQKSSTRRGLRESRCNKLIWDASFWHRVFQRASRQA